jgi:RNA polymerase sigma factor (sigma-70 family)
MWVNRGGNVATTLLNGAFDLIRTQAMIEAGTADGELLARYIEHADAASFEVLVRRHGSMILGVCRRVLRNNADAEDAVQATFLVLIRKAKMIRQRDRLANWLYGVALNTALKARAMSRLRHEKERRAGSPDRSTDRGDREADFEQLLAHLDSELRFLPEIYRLPIILCDLEGQTIQEAAKAAGCPVGTIASRLARGRALLAKRLSRHGLKLSVGSFASLLADRAASACLPGPLFNSVIHSGSILATGTALGSDVVSAPVAALTERVLKMMLLKKLTSVCLALVAAVIFTAAIGATAFALRAAPAAQVTKAAPVAPVTKAAPIPKNPGPAKHIDDPSLGYLLRHPVVIEELKLTDEQKTNIDEAFALVEKELAEDVGKSGGLPPAGGEVPKELDLLDKKAEERMSKAFQNVSKTILKPEQLKRLSQISLQMSGPPLYSSSTIAKALKLSDDQQKKATLIVEDYMKANQEWLKDYSQWLKDSGGQMSPDKIAELERISKAASGKFYELLKKDQQTVWKEMIGSEIPIGKMITRE